MVRREMFSFHISGKMCANGGCWKKEQVFILCVKCRAHFKPARAPRDFWKAHWIDCTSEGCFTVIQQFSSQKILSVPNYYVDTSLMCARLYVYVCGILFTGPTASFLWMCLCCTLGCWTSKTSFCVLLTYEWSDASAFIFSTSALSLPWSPCTSPQLCTAIIHRDFSLAISTCTAVTVMRSLMHIHLLPSLKVFSAVKSWPRVWRKGLDLAKNLDFGSPFGVFFVWHICKCRGGGYGFTHTFGNEGFDGL